MNIPLHPDLCLIRADHLTVFAGGRSIIEDVHLSVSKGEIVVLIGPNGSGKTTLLRALQGLVPSRGSITKRPQLRI
jgi:ABC-type cobalamin/Fe3+-siderophores transport system ATPase subunit